MPEEDTNMLTSLLDSHPTKQNLGQVLHLGYERKVTQGRRDIVRHPLADVPTTGSITVEEDFQAEPDLTNKHVSAAEEDNRDSPHDCNCLHRPMKIFVTRPVAVQVDISKSVDHHFAVKQYATKTKNAHRVKLNIQAFKNIESG